MSESRPDGAMLKHKSTFGERETATQMEHDFTNGSCVYLQLSQSRPGKPGRVSTIRGGRTAVRSYIDVTNRIGPPCCACPRRPVMVPSPSRAADLRCPDQVCGSDFLYTCPAKPRVRTQKDWTHHYNCITCVLSRRTKGFCFVLSFFACGLS